MHHTHVPKNPKTNSNRSYFTFKTEAKIKLFRNQSTNEKNYHSITQEKNVKGNCARTTLFHSIKYRVGTVGFNTHTYNTYAGRGLH